MEGRSGLTTCGTQGFYNIYKLVDGTGVNLKEVWKVRTHARTQIGTRERIHTYARGRRGRSAEECPCAHLSARWLDRV